MRIARLVLAFLPACLSNGSETVTDDPTSGAVPRSVIATPVIPAGHDDDETWFFGDGSVAIARSELAALQPGQSTLLRRLQLARAMLATGESATAATELSQLMADIDSGIEVVKPSFRLRVLRELATAWLRVGEQDNCVLHHGTESCLAPISPSGQHSDPLGSLEATKVLEQLLAARPGDLQARWLLNIARMTVGRWPHGIPADLIIPPEAFASDALAPRLSDVAASCGLAERQLAGGLCVDDFDGDGLLDVVTSEAAPNRPMHYLRNEGGHFTDLSQVSGVSGITGGSNLFHGDVENDGDSDILVVRSAGLPFSEGEWPLSLLLGDGQGYFRDGAFEAGLTDPFTSTSAAFADFNLDGSLDLFVGNQANEYYRRVSRFYANRGDGVFTEVVQQQAPLLIADVVGCAWGDADADGDPDLGLSLRAAPPMLLRNSSTRFADVAADSGIDGPPRGSACCWLDFDEDGELDVFFAGWRAGVMASVCADYLGAPAVDSTPRLYRGRGGGLFQDVTEACGLLHVMPTQACNAGDVDGDGWLDLYLGTGEPDLCALLPNRMFRNDEGRRFQDVTTTAGVGHLQKGSALAFADLDNDGDHDLMEVMGGLLPADAFHRVCFENPTDPANWVSLELEGVESNRSAIGAKVRIRVLRPNGQLRTLHRIVGASSGAGSQSLRLDVSIGDARTIDSIEIEWPGMDGPQVVRGVAIGQCWSIQQGTSAVVRERPVVQLGGR